MKKVIEGSLYNTETAKELGCWTNEISRSDFHYVTETLYRTKSGKYFLYGEGGALSKYAESCGQNQWCGGKKIIPIPLTEAQKWAEKNLDGDEYIAAFGEPEEGKTQINLYLSQVSIAKLERLRSETGKSISQIVDGLI